MNYERWQRVKEIFEAASERGPTERVGFITQACADDEELRREVESLLAAHDADSGFMNTPVGSLLGSEKPLLTTGQRFGQYEEISALGEGGMGQVYLALDTRLGRKVALKLLPSSFTHDADRVCRFGLEARAASALNHPNIVTIHEIGQTDSLHFIATEFVDGKTLREHMTNGRMTVGEVLDVAVQVASALQAAHEAGIVHRDIKPENIMLRRDRVVKVLDFGLAKLTPEQVTAVGAQGPAQSMVQTNPGVVMGTVGYMSPEQARGQEVDARTDIWSLGVVLYEMVAGRAPFEGETPSHVIVSILESTPRPLSLDPEVPADLGRIVTKALRKTKNERYQTAGDLALDLKNLKEELTLEARLKQLRRSDAYDNETPKSGLSLLTETTRELPANTVHGVARQTASVEYFVSEIKRHKTLAGAALLVLLVGALGLTYSLINRSQPDLGVPGKKSLAVLPLKPIDATHRDDIFELGITDSLIQRLSSMQGFTVRSLSVTSSYRDIAQDPIAAGKQQQVDYVLAANYQLVDGRIRVTAQLFNVATEQAEKTYQIEKDASDVFAMQDAIASEVENGLLALFPTTSRGRTAERGTTNEEAYRFYLHGKNLTNQRNAEADKKAIENFEQAIRLDPNYARAYAGMANAYHSLGIHGGLPRIEDEKAKQAIKKALELDSNLAEAYAVRGIINFAYEWDFTASEKDLATAIELEPNNDTAHWGYALLSAYQGRFDKAMTEIETALRIAPGTPTYERDRGRILYYFRRYDEAIVQLKRTIELKQDFPSAWSWLWRAYEMKGDYAAAYETFMKSRKDPERIEVFRKAYEAAGWQGVERKFLEFSKLDEQKRPVYLYDIAALSALLGEKDQAFEYLSKAVEQRRWEVAILNVDPQLDSLRDDPRFVELVRRVESK